MEDVATPEAFRRDPRLVWDFYQMRRQAAAVVSPNPAHRAIASFAAARRKAGQRFTLITQNIDGLHERSASEIPDDASYILAMHGSLELSRCTRCETLTPAGEDQQGEDGLPHSKCCGSLLRPHVVWFGEVPLFLDQIQAAVSECDLFVSIGTSGNVYPAAGLIQLAKMAGARTVSVNKEPIPQQLSVDDYLEGPAGSLVPRLFGSN